MSDPTVNIIFGEAALEVAFYTLSAYEQLFEKLKGYEGDNAETIKEFCGEMILNTKDNIRRMKKIQQKLCENIP